MRDALGRVGTVALIGGTSDIGIAISARLGEMGTTRFILAGRDESRLHNVGASLGKNVSIVPLDVADTPSHPKAVASIFAERDVDVVVLAAGLLERTPGRTAAVRMAQVNYTGSLSVLLEVADAMKQQGHGQIVVMSSAGITRPRPANYLYASSKAALDFAARGLLAELEGTNVNITIVRPGFVKSSMTAGLSPTPLSSTTTQVAEAVALAVREERVGTVWVPSAIRFLSFALRLMPAFLLRRIEQ